VYVVSGDTVRAITDEDGTQRQRRRRILPDLIPARFNLKRRPDLHEISFIEGWKTTREKNGTVGTMYGL
jgi:hypothetical protein